MICTSRQYKVDGYPECLTGRESMRKKKYIIAALAAGMCLSVIPGSTVSAEKQQADSGILSVVNSASDAVNVVSQVSGSGNGQRFGVSGVRLQQS